MVLNIPIAIDRFFDYLAYNFPESTKCFALFFDLRLYDHEVENEEGDDESRIQFAMEIYKRYLKDGSEHQVVLDPPVMATFLEKYEAMIENTDDAHETSIMPEHLFLEVYCFVINTLRHYFTTFKNSPDFVQLEDDIMEE